MRSMTIFHPEHMPFPQLYFLQKLKDQFEPNSFYNYWDAKKYPEFTLKDRIQDQVYEYNHTQRLSPSRNWHFRLIYPPGKILLVQYSSQGILAEITL